MFKPEFERTNYRDIHNLEIIVVLKVYENARDFVDMKACLCSFKIPNVTFV